MNFWWRDYRYNCFYRKVSAIIFCIDRKPLKSKCGNIFKCVYFCGFKEMSFEHSFFSSIQLQPDVENFCCFFPSLSAHVLPFLLCFAAPKPCSSNPCQNGGTCLNSPDGVSFSCMCSEEWEGRLCEKGTKLVHALFCVKIWHLPLRWIVAIITFIT